MLDCTQTVVSDEEIEQAIVEFIGPGYDDWRVVIVGHHVDVHRLLARLHFSAPSHLALAKSVSQLRGLTGSVLGVSHTRIELIEGVHADRVMVVVQSRTASPLVLSYCYSINTVPVVLWGGRGDEGRLKV